MDHNVSKNARLLRICCTTVLSVIAVFWLIPIAWVIINSFKTNLEFATSYTSVNSAWEYLQAVFPDRLNLSTYISLFTGEGMSTTTGILKMITNSVIISVTRTVVVVFTTALAAFSFERLRFPAGDKIFWALFFISLIPSSASTLPLFKICNAFGWVNNINALIWPGCVSIMNIFLIRNFLVGIPKELDEAARIDGAGIFKILWKVDLPMITPALATLVIFNFNGVWSEFYWALIVIKDEALKTLPLGLINFQSQFTSDYGVLTAGLVILTVPVVAVYLFFSRYFIAGISAGAVKG